MDGRERLATLPFFHIERLARFDPRRTAPTARPNGYLSPGLPLGKRALCCSACSLAVNRCDSEIRSTSTAIASTAASMRSRRPLIAPSSRGGTGRGSSHLVINRTIGNPSTIMTSPGITQEKTSWTIRFGSGGIFSTVRGRLHLTIGAARGFRASLHGKRIAPSSSEAQPAKIPGGSPCHAYFVA